MHRKTSSESECAIISSPDEIMKGAYYSDHPKSVGILTAQTRTVSNSGHTLTVHYNVHYKSFFIQNTIESRNPETEIRKNCRTKKITKNSRNKQLFYVNCCLRVNKINYLICRVKPLGINVFSSIGMGWLARDLISRHRCYC